MIALQELFWCFSVISVSIYCLQALNKAFSKVSQGSWVIQLLFVTKNFIVEDSKARFLAESQGFHEKDNLNEDYQEGSGKSHRATHDDQKRGIRVGSSQNDNARVLMDERSSEMAKIGVSKASIKLDNRPSRLLVPDFMPDNLGWGKNGSSLEHTAFEVAGRDFFLACKKGTRRDHFLEDGYSVMVDILGDPKQAFFAVIDGHGGRAAADFVAENLGKNIVKRLENNADQLEEAIHKAYSVTDKEFLNQGFSGGACAVSVFLKEGELHAANLGDCRVVLSRKGVAQALTTDHRLSREDERLRIEKSGGFVHYYTNGVWRVQGSLAVSRAIGDSHLKEWVISEPEITRLPLTADCQFLILASDGLWDKVTEQEAVDLVKREGNIQDSCRKLIDISCTRGAKDDMTVMVVQLQSFLPN